MKPLILPYILALTLSWAICAEAQSRDYRVGTKVRLWMLDNGVPITGMVEEVDPSRLKLAGEYGARFEVKTFRIKDAQVFHGTIDPDKDYASMTGFFTGMVLAGGLGWFLRDNGDIGCCDAPLAVAVRWGAIGAGIGGIMGAVSTQEREIWRPIPKLAVTIPIE